MRKMLNKYPLWKYLLIVFLLLVGFVYALPNLYRPDPAIQISGSSSAMEMNRGIMQKAVKALDEAGVAYFGEEIGTASILIRLQDQDLQLKAKDLVKRALGDDYIVALNLAPTTPDWLTSIGAGPMKLGLDLSGGVHFLLEVDIQAAVHKRLSTQVSEIKRLLREAGVRGRVGLQDDNTILAVFQNDALRDEASSLLRKELPNLQRLASEEDGRFNLLLSLTELQIKEIEDYAVTQNLTTLRNRVNELGVAEPLVQKQGRNRIVVELPGVQDTAEAKRVLGKFANLEFRLEARHDDPFSSKEEFEFRSANAFEQTAWLERKSIITGDQVTNAQSNFDPQDGRPQVNVNLDGQGGALMHRVTRKNVKRRMGVLFIERKTRTVGYEKDDEGNEVPVLESYDVKKIISLATIQSALGTQFRITGLDSTAEASELALLLRAGALAAPTRFVEERTVGPSLGAENIALGVRSVQIGLAMVLIFMVIYYRVFGLAADLALAINIVLLVAMMSMLSATLTLPGIAGIVLTVGMAVDANVLIFARIREELKNGLSPQAAIDAGYGRAFVTILDANLTTLLVAVILYAIGTGPVRGFAVTLSLGIITSMFTAIMGTRALVNLIYGGRRVQKLAI
jgi:preprotein translocase subunit SecD